MRRLLIATTLATLLAGCGDHGHTDGLVIAGKNASNHLQSYYDHATKATLDWWEYQVAYNTLQDVPTTQALERTMTERVVALRARAAMAGRLSDVYDAISQLRSPKSTAPVVTAAQGLGKTLASLPGLPGVNLADGLGQAADALAGIQRNHDLAKANTALTASLAHIRDVFVHEQDAYQSIHRDRDQTRHALVQTLARKQFVNTAPLLERLKLGVPWTNTTDPAMARTLALTIDSISVQRSDNDWSCVTQETSTILELLVAGHEQLTKNRLPSPFGLQRAQARAAACLASD